MNMPYQLLFNLHFFDNHWVGLLCLYLLFVFLLLWISHEFTHIYIYFWYRWFWWGFFVFFNVFSMCIYPLILRSQLIYWEVFPLKSSSPLITVFVPFLVVMFRKTLSPPNQIYLHLYFLPLLVWFHFFTFNY